MIFETLGINAAVTGFIWKIRYFLFFGSVFFRISSPIVILNKSHEVDDVVPYLLPTSHTTLKHRGKMCNRPLPAAPLPNRFPSSTTIPPLPASKTSTAVNMIKRCPAVNVSIQQKRSKWVPIIPHPPAPAPSTSRAQFMRKGYARAPSNEFCPRGCNNCGLSFVPRGFGSDFCSGECRHSFAFLRHMEKKHDKKKH